MNVSDPARWLQHTDFSALSLEVIEEIAKLLQEQTFSANHNLVIENTRPLGLYILKTGKLEGKCTSSSLINAHPVAFLPGAIINLRSLLLNQLTSRTVTTLTECQFWFIPAEAFQQVVKHHPEIIQSLSQELARELAQLSEQFIYEQERQAVLRPYLVTKAKRGIIGKSRYAVRLRNQIKQASEDCKPVFIFGEPGLEKDNIAALIHFGSAQRRKPIIKINCSTLPSNGALLFGRIGGKPGLLEWLGEGTLMLNNVHELSKELIPKIAQLLKTGSYKTSGEETEEKNSSEPFSETRCKTRIIMVSEKALPALEKEIRHLIKVPPLRVRKADISAQIDYYISLLSRDRSIAKPGVTPEALRRLQSYDFPGNLRELEGLVERAMIQTGTNGKTPLTEEVFWSIQTKKKRFRVNLLNAYPQFRNFLRSPWWPDRINYGITLWLFAVVVGILVWGPQGRSQNFALNLFWAWWWPLVLIAFPFVGRLWCAVCPFMIYGEVTQKLSLWLFPRSLKKWPREAAEKWGGWFIFGLFTLIYLWEELWNLEDTAYLSACLLLLITAGAMIFSTLFERRFWCRYLCPIGGMNGLFAKLSMTELRAQQGTCSAECTTYQCYKGGPQKGEGLETEGCPLYSHPAQLEDNRDCVLCMTCLKACPHRSVEFNLRPPGIELWTTHIPRSYEVALLLLLLGGVFLHRLPEIQSLFGLSLNLQLFLPHLGFSVLVLGLPSLLIFLAYGIMKLIKIPVKKHSFVELAYGYLPLVLAGNLAHFLRLGLSEGGRLLPLTFATFGFRGEGLPVFVAHPAVIAFLQGTVLILGVISAMILTQKIARQAFRLLSPQHLAILGIGLGMWRLIVG